MIRCLRLTRWLLCLAGLLVTRVSAESPEFSIEVMSILSKAGCNAGTCHGNLNGKGGFKLSLRGQDPAFDHHALVSASRGRRVNILAPQESLFLRKATGLMPHEGGVRFVENSDEYRELLAWLLAGAPGPSAEAPRLVDLRVEPSQAVVFEPEQALQLGVTAVFSDGTSKNVTSRACYELSNLNAEVDPGGCVTRNQLGETTLVVRYLQRQVPVPIAFCAEQPDFRWASPTEFNKVDQHVFAKLRRLRINPSELCDDHTFIRRAFLDAIGRLPTAAEVKTFVHDASAAKRSDLIDRLLARPEFSDYWALKWADVLRVEEKVLDPRGVELFHAWIRGNIERALPMDEFVRELVTGTGSTFEQPAANYYRANRDPSTRGETTARLFLGTRLQCAKCHNHPFDRWTQDDYYRWSSVFSQIDYEEGDNERQDKLDKNEFAGEQTVLVAKMDEVRNPVDGSIASAKLLGGPELTDNQRADRLTALADWLTSPDNRLFAKAQVNFVWYHLMGRGLVDPIDDFRLTNPPSNPELLDALTDGFIEGGFNLRQLVSTIMNSRTYQLSSEPNASNVADETCYSRAYVSRLPAEVILDMQSDVLDTPAGFVGYDKDMRAVQIPGVQRKRARDERPQLGDRFLKTFGKPERIMACDCERSNETTLKQVFSLLGDDLNQRILASGKLKQLTQSNINDEDIVQELYWSSLSRPPSEQELAVAVDLLQAAPDRRQETLQDITWALLNAKEFLFRR